MASSIGAPAPARDQPDLGLGKNPPKQDSNEKKDETEDSPVDMDVDSSSKSLKGEEPLPIFETLQKTLAPLIKANYKFKTMHRYEFIPPSGDCPRLLRDELAELAVLGEVNGRLAIRKFPKDSIKYLLFSAQKFEQKTIVMNGHAWYFKQIIKEKKKIASKGTNKNYASKPKIFNGERLAKIHIYNLPQIYDNTILKEIAKHLGIVKSISSPQDGTLSFGTVTMYFKQIYRDIDEGKVIKIDDKHKIFYVIAQYVHESQEIFYIDRPENFLDQSIVDNIINQKFENIPSPLDKFNYTKNKEVAEFPQEGQAENTDANGPDTSDSPPNNPPVSPSQPQSPNNPTRPTNSNTNSIDQPAPSKKTSKKKKSTASPSIPNNKQQSNSKAATPKVPIKPKSTGTSPAPTTPLSSASNNRSSTPLTSGPNPPTPVGAKGTTLGSQTTSGSKRKYTEGFFTPKNPEKVHKNTTPDSGPAGARV